MSQVRLGVFAVLVSALGLSCAGSSSSGPSGKPNSSWKDMTKDERAALMKNTVMPKMKAEFIAFDAKDFGEMNCVTCHGESAKDKSFKMPNPKLPKLPTTEEGFKKLSEEEPDAMKFMGSKVVPQMAAFLGEAPYDPKTHQGFGCFRCHVKKD